MLTAVRQASRSGTSSPASPSRSRSRRSAGSRCTEGARSARGPARRHPDLARLAHHAEAAGDREAVLASRRRRRRQAARSARTARPPPSTRGRFASRDGLPPEARAELLKRRPTSAT